MHNNERVSRHRPIVCSHGSYRCDGGKFALILIRLTMAVYIYPRHTSQSSFPHTWSEATCHARSWVHAYACARRKRTFCGGQHIVKPSCFLSNIATMCMPSRLAGPLSEQKQSITAVAPNQSNLSHHACSSQKHRAFVRCRCFVFLYNIIAGPDAHSRECFAKCAVPGSAAAAIGSRSLNR